LERQGYDLGMYCGALDCAPFESGHLDPGTKDIVPPAPQILPPLALRHASCKFLIYKKKKSCTIGEEAFTILFSRHEAAQYYLHIRGRCDEGTETVKRMFVPQN
jgi:hypothetical protein